MTVGENIRRIRKEKGLTQKELGKLCGINEAQIRRYELGGKNSNPKIETIEKIAVALDVSMTDLMGNITFAQLQKTEIYKKALVHANAYHGVKFILAAIYGNVEQKEVELKTWNDNDMEESEVETYYLIGTDENKFVLYMNDIENLLEYLKSSIPFVVDNMKDSRSEPEIIEAIRQNLRNRPKPEV